MLFRGTPILKKQIAPRKTHGVGAVSFYFVQKAKYTSAGAWGFIF
jgi:hypothetical protein